MRDLAKSAALTIFAACAAFSPAQAQDVRGETMTVDELVADRETYERFKEECANNPGELEFTPNCINTLDAGRRIMSIEIREALESGQ